MPAMTPSTLRIGYRYRPTRLAEKYDAVVIGSGMGGLTTAALLSDLGWKVCVLEQHYTAGGYTHSYERNGYEWDVGVHYIGEVGAKTRTRQMFDYLSSGKLEWAPMDAEYDRFYIGDKVFNAKAGKQEYRDNLVRQFPNEAEAIDKYLKLLNKVGSALPAIGMKRTFGFWHYVAMWPYLLLKSSRFVFRNTYDVLSELTDDQGVVRPVGRYGITAEALHFSRACNDRQTLFAWRLLSDWRLLENRRFYYSEDPGCRRGGVHLRAR